MKSDLEGRAEPIRVLQILGGLFHGGAEAMIMSLYHHMDTSKVQFDFLVHTDQEGVYDKEIIDCGGKIHHAPEYHGYNHFGYKAWWQFFLKEHPEYHILHFHIRGTAAIAIPIAKRMGRITIAHSHSTDNGKSIKAALKNVFQHSLKNQADYLFACSEPAAIWLFGKKVLRADNFFLWKNAIETNKFSFNEDIRQKMRTSFEYDDVFVIGHVGRFITAKNHMFLLDVFSEIYKQNSKARLLLIGDGELRFPIEQKIQSIHLDDVVTLAGARSDVQDCLQAMDVFLFPSLFEGLGIVAIEAQANGLPCIVSDSIPQEVKMSELLTFVSLKKPTEYWAQQVLSHYKEIRRAGDVEQIKKAGYDIIESAQALQAFYLHPQRRLEKE
nr:glycosyltransferase family 1 protein [uncultured Sphaerochaeta sp.]